VYCPSLRREFPFAIVPPQRLQTGGPEAFAPGNPLTRYGHPAYTAWPDGALLRQAAAVCWGSRWRSARGAAAGAGGQRRGRCENAVSFSYPWGGLLGSRHRATTLRVTRKCVLSGQTDVRRPSKDEEGGSPGAGNGDRLRVAQSDAGTGSSPIVSSRLTAMLKRLCRVRLIYATKPVNHEALTLGVKSSEITNPPSP
jgi:hypothetical protein